MASLLVSQSTRDSGLSYWGSTSRSLQTFTMPSGYDTIEYIDLQLQENGTLPGNYTLELYATSGGLPTGSVLATTSVTASDVTGSYSWIRFNFTDETVTPGAKYAIVTKQTSTSGISNSVYWGEAGSGGYSGGAGYYSTNSGSSWTSTGGDFCFRIYGSQSATAPTVTTTAASSVTTTGADSGGNVTSDGGATITERGVVYSSSNDTPTTANSKATTSGTTGAYSVTLSGLTAGTHYYTRAYAINSQGTSYGAVAEFDTTTTTPSITTSGYASVTSVGAIVSANVTSDGGSAVTERGVCWNTSTTPTTANSKSTSGTGTGSYTVTIATMSVNTLYYIRPYAINANGTTYGTEVSFTTLDLVKYWAQSFSAGATGTLTKVSLVTRLASGVIGNLKVRIYSDSAGSPNALVYTANTVNVTNTAYATVDVTVNYAVTSGVTYWVVIEDPYTVGSYHLYFGSNSAGGYASGAIKYTKSSAPSSWINTNHTTDDMAFYVYIQPSLSTSYNLTVKSRRRYL
jgi:hypothetical protein